MQLFESIGTLHYEPDWKLVLNIDQNLADYYRSLIPKYKPNNRQRYPAHVTIVRQTKELPTNIQFWNKYQGQEVKFLYNPEIQEGQVYYWINVYCQQLEEIRTELGLPVHSQFTMPPEGFKKHFHCTIGNKKL